MLLVLLLGLVLQKKDDSADGCKHENSTLGEGECALSVETEGLEDFNEVGDDGQVSESVNILTRKDPDHTMGDH